MPKLTQPVRACIFCEIPGNLSKEHVIAKMMAEFLPHQGPYASAKVFGEDRKITSVYFRQGGLAALRTVCRNCNSGWMREIDERAKPILAALVRDQVQPISAAQQATLSVWACKTSMVIHSHKQEEKIIPQPQRTLMKRKQEIPTGWFVWAGRVNDVQSRVHLIYQSTMVCEEYDGVGPPAPFGRSQGTTIQLDSLLFRVESCANPTYRIDRSGDPRFKRFWPSPQDALWPPLLYWDNKAIEQLETQFGPPIKR